jgi:hypothetical protein
MLATLVVGGRPIAARTGVLASDTFDVSIERQIEVEAGLFAVSNDIESGSQLILDGNHGCVTLELRNIVSSEVRKVFGCVFEPCGEGITTDDRRTQGIRLHQFSFVGCIP